MKHRKIYALLLALTMLCGCASIENNEASSLTQTTPLQTSATTTETETQKSETTISTNDTVQTSATTFETTISQTTLSEPLTQTENTYITSTTDTTDRDTFKIAFAGDVTQFGDFGQWTEMCGYDYALGDVAPIFNSADLAFVNYESSVSTRGQSEKPEGYGFRTDPKYLQTLLNAGIDIVSLANNHVRDYGIDALYDTLDSFDRTGIIYCGAGKDISDASSIKIITANGYKIGFIACNEIMMGSDWQATNDRPGMWGLSDDTYKDIARKIKEYDKQVDILIVSCHWGIEYSNGITDAQRTYAQAFVDAGADLIIGHHPHVLEPIEFYKNVPICYSMGNFLFLKKDDNAGKTAVIQMEFDKNGFVNGSLSPVFISYCKSNLLKKDDEMYGEIIGLMQKISAPYGTSISNNGKITKS